MKLTHVGISNFRSIGEEFVTINLTKKINVLVGANNCGKSNVLRALLRLNKGEVGRAFTKEDMHNLSEDRRPVFRCTCLLPSAHSAENIPAQLDWVVETNGLHCIATGWDSLDFQSFNKIWFALKNNFFGSTLHGEDLKSLMRDTGNGLVRGLVHEHVPRIAIIPQFREIVQGEKYSFGGMGIVKLLATWDRPAFGYHRDAEKLAKVRDLLRELLQEPDVNLQVTHSHDQIIVVNNGLHLPLESCGTGIHELIILAIAVLSIDSALICVEEPEIHLHPLLQRRFLEFLRKETTNRYVITTHSPALIAPNEDIAVTHLWLENGTTKSRLVETNGHSLQALRDLGAKASDLLQANSIIWVEGPSDRIYLNRWLELLHPGEFREGIDYAVMFYGGRLLAHVSLEREATLDTPDEEDADDLVSLLRINQHSAVLIDSDRRKANTPLNPTKLRVEAECKKSGIPCWITVGREIENCLPVEAIAAAFAEIAEVPTPELRLPRYGAIETALDTALRKSWKRSNYYDHAKPQRARLIAKHMTKEQTSLEVKEWIDRLARLIRHDPSP